MKNIIIRMLLLVFNLSLLVNTSVAQDEDYCPPAWDLSKVNIGGIYQAEYTITSSAKINSNLARVIFKAGDYISLEPGFLTGADDGYLFRTEIIKCDSNFGTSKQMTADLTNSIYITNYPNPFASATTIEYTLPFEKPVTLFVTDMMGKKVATLLNNEEQTKGSNHINFDGSAFPPGMYYYTLQAGDFVSTQKMILMK